MRRSRKKSAARYSGYVHAIGKDKMGYVTYAQVLSLWCDCVNFSNRPLVPNLEVFAFRDPVAIDMAFLEMVEKFAAMPGSRADDPWGLEHRDNMQAQDWSVEPFSYDNLRMSFVEMSTRPRGMAAEREL